MYTGMLASNNQDTDEATIKIIEIELALSPGKENEKAEETDFGDLEDCEYEDIEDEI